MIITLTEPCWRQVDSDGHDYPEDPGPCHFETEAEAVKTLTPPGWPPLAEGGSIRPYATPCVMLARDCCDIPVEDDEFGGIHFPDEETAREMASFYELRIVGDRVVCGPDIDCDSEEEL